MKKIATVALCVVCLLCFGAASECMAQETGKVLKRKVAIGRFTNETQYAKGLFYDRDNDPMRKQALDILSTKLGASGKFILLERDDLDVLMKEAQEHGNSLNSIGADFLILGSITEFGRKNEGQQGVFRSTKTQTVEAAVSVRLVDVATGLILYTDEARGTAETVSKKTMGFGGQADFDATLSDKAISAAISQLVDNVINKCMDKPWRSYLLAEQDGMWIISGGASQGIQVGDRFSVMRKGRQVKNPQTGILIELPGKQAGEVTILSLGGDTPETEFSLAELTGEVDKDNLGEYYIEQIKN